MKNNTFDDLLLLEFMINNVTFFESNYNIDRNYLDQLGETRVQVKVNSCCLLEITDEEECSNVIDENGNRIVNFESGKSCLLSMSQIMNNDSVASMCVARKDPCGGVTGYYTFGEASVSLEPIFKQVKKGGKGKKSIKTLKGTYKFIDRQCSEAGTIDIFMRATNLGKKVTTMFQLGAGESSFYYKGVETDPCSSVEEDESSLFACPQLETGENVASKSARLEQFHTDENHSKSRRPPCPGSQKNTCQSKARSVDVFPVNAYPLQQNGLPATHLPLLQYDMPTMGMGGTCAAPMGGHGTVMGGPGTFMGGPGTFMGGPGTVMNEPGMAMGAPGMAMGAPGMAIGAPGMAMGAPGINTPTVGPYGYQNQDTMGNLIGYNNAMNEVAYRDEDYEQLDGEYKEISAEVNGYEMKIKLLRRPKKVVEQT